MVISNFKWNKRPLCFFLKSLFKVEWVFMSMIEYLLIFHTFDPRNIFYICLTDSWILFHRQEHGQLFLKCLAEKDSCTGKKSNQLTKKTMIQRFSLWNTWLATTLTRCALLGDGRVLVAGGYHGFGQPDPSDLSSSEVDTIPWFGFWWLLYF